MTVSFAVGNRGLRVSALGRLLADANDRCPNPNLLALARRSIAEVKGRFRCIAVAQFPESDDRNGTHCCPSWRVMQRQHRVGCRRPSCVVERPVTARLLTFAHPRSTAPWARSNGRQDRLLPTGATGSSTIGEAAVDDVGPCHSRGCRTHRRHRRDPNKIALSPGWKMARHPTVKLTTFTVTRKRRLQKT